MIPRLRLLAAATLVAAGAALAGCSGSDAVNQGVGGSTGFQTAAGFTWVAPGDRSAVGAVHGTLLDGRAFDLAQWRGHVVVVNFWESDCGPCRAEAAALEQVSRDESSHGVRFLGIDVRDNRAAAQSYVHSHHVSYPSLFDTAGTVALDFAGLPPNATPTTIVIDRRGRIALRHSGSILFTQLRDAVRRVTAEPA